jgi:predicted  nucleic acid-binding Zn-ribbon protein
VRFFPSAEGIASSLRTRIRARRAVPLLVLVLASAAFLVPHAAQERQQATAQLVSEDEERLKERQRKVQSDIKQAEKDLQESSRRVQRLSNRLETAESELRGARSYLSEVQGELAAARERATRIAGQLEQAEQRLETATNRVRKARRKVDQQRDDVRDTVITFATTGDPRIASLGALLNSRSLEEVMINQTANQLVVDVQFQSLHDLQDAEEALRKRRQQVREARNAVQEKKDEADAQVQRTEQLVGRASAARDEVDRLVCKALERLLSYITKEHVLPVQGLPILHLKSRPEAICRLYVYRFHRSGHINRFWIFEFRFSIALFVEQQD